MKIKFHGHACFTILNNDNTIIIDPFLTGNPLAKEKAENINAKVVLISHGHGDHFADALPIAQKNDALIIAPYELAMYCQSKGARVHPMHIGGSFQFDFGKIKLTPAWHGSAIIDNNTIQYVGNPCGFLIEINGFTIYHAGDTGLFGDMELIGRLNKIDVALLPIGDNFVMGIDDAVEAVKLLKPKLVIPMHYNTFDVIKQDPFVFKQSVEDSGYQCRVLDIEDEINI